MVDLKEGPFRMLVLFHGFMGSSDDWDGFDFGCPTHKVTLPGHGDNTQPFSLKRLHKLLREHPKINLCGYSMGGRVAMTYAKAYPHHVDKLILVGAHPGLPKKNRSKRWEEDRDIARALLELPLEEFVRRWYKSTLFGPINEEHIQRRLHNDPEMLAKALLTFSLANQDDYTPFLKQHPNLLYLAGERDSKYVGIGRQFQTFEIVPDAYHHAHLDQPHYFEERVHNFIEGRLPSISLS